jgi:glutathione S-transferase
MLTYPILYSFVRCPYAIRARFALKYVGIRCLLREVNLKSKTAALLAVSAKGTVPVLLLPSGDVIDESIKIIEWALEQYQPANERVLPLSSDKKSQELIEFNDTIFVKIIHKYKYRDRYPEIDHAKNEQAMHEHLQKLNNLLEQHTFLFSGKLSMADLGLFPFIRQIFTTNPDHFQRLGLIHLSRWLDYFVKHPLFPEVMAKHSVWQPDDDPIVF